MFVLSQDTPSGRSSDITSSSQNGKTTKKRTGKTKGSSSKSSNGQSSHSCQNDDNSGFEISTKVKGPKRVKDPAGRNFGGDIYQPTSLELPYTLKPIRNRDSDRDKDSHKVPKTSLMKVSISLVVHAHLCSVVVHARLC